MFIKKGIPWKEHKRLNDIVVSLESEMREAKINGNEHMINELHLLSSSFVFYNDQSIHLVALIGWPGFDYLPHRDWRGASRSRAA